MHTRIILFGDAIIYYYTVECQGRVRKSALPPLPVRFIILNGSHNYSTIIVMSGVVVEAVMMILPRPLFTRLRKTDCISCSACIVYTYCLESSSAYDVVIRIQREDDTNY